MVDVDWFKSNNDKYGHQGGDFCLQQVAALVNEAAQRPGDIRTRYGGEEFVIVLPGAELAGALVEAADQELYKAKGSGRNRVSPAGPRV
jgi:diguanylate cyclase (GGDEF)-like protein